MAQVGITQSQMDSVVANGVQLFNSVTWNITRLFTNVIDLFKANPMAVLGGLVVLGMVNNSQGGIKLGKAFEIKM